MSQAISDFYAAELAEEAIGALLADGGLDPAALLGDGLWDGRTHVRRNAACALSLATAAPGFEGIERHDLFPIAAKDADAVVRRHTVKAMGELRLEARIVVPALLRALGDRDPLVVEAAWHSLEKLLLTRPPEILPLLIDALGDDRPFVMVAASDLLLKGGPPAAEALVRALGHDSSAVRDGAFHVLEQLSTVATPSLIPALDDRVRREMATRLLLALPAPEPEEEEALKGLEGAADALTRAAAGQVLRSLAAARRRPKPTPFVPPTPEFTERALTEAELQAVADAAPPIAGLVPGLRDGRPHVRLNVAHALGLLIEAADADARALAAAGLGPVARDPEPAVRAAAVLSLGQLARVGSTVVVDPLVVASSDADDEVRRLAQIGLLALSAAGASGSRALIGAIRPEQPRTAHRAIVAALGGLGGPAVLPLSEAVRAARHPTVRELAADALRRIGPGAAAALDGLYAALADPVDAVRQAAARAVGVVGEGAAEEALARLDAAMADGTLAVRREAAMAMARLKGEPVGPQGPTEPEPIAVDGFEERVLTEEALAGAAGGLELGRLVRGLRDGRKAVRVNAATTLGLRGPEAVLAAPALSAAVKDADPFVRLAAAIALGRLGPEAVPFAAAALIGALADRAPVVAEAAKRSLQGLGAPALAPLLAAMGGDPDLVGRTVLKVLPGFGAPARDGLVALLRDGAPRARLNALRGLSRLGRQEAAPARELAAALARDPDPDTAAEARRLVDVIDGREAPPKALEALPLPVEGFDARSLEAAELTQAAKKLTGERLAALLTDGRPFVRENAARALGLMGAKAEPGHDGLILALKDADTSVRAAAAESLGQLRAAPQRAVPAMILALRGAAPLVEVGVMQALDAYGEAAEGPARALLVEDWDVLRATLAVVVKAYPASFVPGLAEALGAASAPAATRVNAARLLAQLPAASLGPARKAAEGAAREADAQVAAEARRVVDVLEGRLPPPKVLEARALPLDGFDAAVVPVEALEKAAKKLDAAPLVDLLSDGRPFVRENAARSLGLLGKAAHGAVAQLALVLRDADPGVRIAAAESLGRLAHDPEVAVPRLVLSLAAGGQQVAPGLQSAVLAAIDAFGDAAVAPLIATLVGRPTEVAPAMARVVAQRPARFVKALGDVLAGAESPIARENAARSLAQLAPTVAEPARAQIVKACADRDGALAALAKAALDALDGVVPPPKVREPRAMPVDGFDARALGADELGKAKKALDVAQLAPLLEDGRAQVRANAARGLATAGKAAHELVPKLAVLLKDAEMDVRVAAAEALGTLAHGPEAAVPPLVQSLKGASEALKAAAMAAVAAFGDKAVDPALRLLGGRPEDLEVTLQPVVLAAPKRFVPALIAVLTTGDTVVRRENAVDLLAALGEHARPAEAALLEALSDSDVLMRLKVIRALPRIAKPSDKVLGALKKLLETERRPTVVFAIKGAARAIKRAMAPAA